MGIGVIRCASVRDPQRGTNLALLACSAFSRAKPVNQRIWRIRLSETGAQAVRESPKAGITFDRAAFAADPRIVRLRWQRRA